MGTVLTVLITMVNGRESEHRTDDIMKKSGWHYKETAVKIHIFAA